MIEKIIKGIKYHLDEENLTAEVIAKRNGYEGDIIIPETVVFKKVAYRVTSIGECAFDGCFSLTSIVIPESVTSIGRRAFADCQWLTTINIPNSVTSIGERAFIWCFALGSITIPDSVKSIEWKAFSGCSLTEITIPSSVTNIGKEAFLDCESLEEIIIGNSVTSIENRAFACCESLFSITYQGTIAQWKEIKFGEDWNEEIPARVVHCTDGDVEI